MQDPTDFILHDPVAAHLYFFPHRHPDDTPAYHEEAIRDMWDYTIPKLLLLIFRGGAKSTLAEEAIILMAAIGAFKHGLIVGDIEPRAADRLTSIKHEFETNERLIRAFGPLVGEPWGYTQACLSNNVLLRAFGRNQKLRGIKFLDHRPDFVFLDDIEDEESTSKEEYIDRTISWVMSVLVPSMDTRKRIIRMAATVIHPSAACVQFSEDASWKTHKVPVWYNSPDPPYSLVSSWEDRFPLEDMQQLQSEYERMGRAREFSQEYLCVAESEETKAFDVTNIPVDPTLLHTFEPTIILCDPARTAKKSSSLTGFVVISWINQRLVIWEEGGYTWRPDQIINHIFDLAARYNPMFIGVEKDGLEEFLLQPIRAEMARRATPLPLVPLKAPRGKLDFIKGLQPYLSSGEIVAACPVPLLQAQLNNFPAGKLDTLNALAYTLHMHPGEPVYQNFNPEQAIFPALLEELPRHRKVTYALNSTATESACAALTLFRGGLAIVADTVIEGAPASSGPEALALLRSHVERAGGLVIPLSHGAKSNTLGLRATLFNASERPSLGGDPAHTRASLQSRIDKKGLIVSDEARITLRALTGGYAYDVNAKTPRKNVYSTLMEAIEAAIPVLINDDTGARNYAIDPRSGREYLTSRPRR